MELLYGLLVLLIFSKLFSELAKRIHFPTILGEIMAGVFLGIIFNFFHESFPVLSELKDNEVFHGITELSVFFLMLYAGMELKPAEFRKASAGAIWIALGGMILPLVLGLSYGWFIIPEGEHQFALILFIGVSMSITAVPVAIRLLMDMGKLQEKAGKAIVSSAVIDDVISLLLLALLTAIASEGELPSWQSMGMIVLKILLFFGITTAIGHYILPRINGWLFKHGLVEEIELSGLLIVALGFAVLAELMGMHFILGAFTAGLFYTRRKMDESVFEGVEKKVKGITTGFLAPFFFASIGLNLDISAIPEIPWIITSMIGLAVVSKLIGTMLPAKFLGYEGKDLWIIGFSMNARGAVEIIIADIVLKAGLLTTDNPEDLVINNLFSAVVIMAIVTTLITPIALRWLAKKD